MTVTVLVATPGWRPSRPLRRELEYISLDKDSLAFVRYRRPAGLNVAAVAVVVSDHWTGVYRRLRRREPVTPCPGTVAGAPTRFSVIVRWMEPDQTGGNGRVGIRVIPRSR